MSRTQYIVTEKQILSTIESALKDHITNPGTGVGILKEHCKRLE